MQDPTESDVQSADSTLTFEQMEVDPFYHPDDLGNPSPVWKHSDYIRGLLKNQALDQERVKALKDALRRQLPTIVLYFHVEVFRKALEKHTSSSKTMSLYVLSFPGEAKDNTGIKDLNDKVLGYNQSSRYI